MKHIEKVERRSYYTIFPTLDNQTVIRMFIHFEMYSVCVRFVAGSFGTIVLSLVAFQIMYCWVRSSFQNFSFQKMSEKEVLVGK